MMTRRRSARPQSAFDSSFQIPLAVDNTANNFLLDDDGLEADFFNGFNDTLSTPLPSQAPLSELSFSILEQQQDLPALRHPVTVNLIPSYDYAQEEQKDGLHLDEDTPRFKRVYDQADSEATPTSHSRREGHVPGHSDAAAPLHTPMSRTRVLTGNFPMKVNEDNSRGTAVHSLHRRSKSPSATPKPRRKSRASSQAPSSVQSTPVGATHPSSSFRPDETQSRSGSCDPVPYITHHEHAPSSRCHPALFSETGSDRVVQFSQVTPAPVEVPNRDPCLPERSLSKLPESSRARRPSTARRRTSRSLARSTSPSYVSRIGHDAVMLPIQEDDEDLQDRGEQASIPKSQYSSNTSLTADNPVKTRNSTELNDNRKHKSADEGNIEKSAASSLQAAGASIPKPRATQSPKGIRKRSGDNLASHRVSKKRKTELNVARSDFNSSEGVRPRDPASRHEPATLVSDCPNPAIVQTHNIKRAVTDLQQVPPRDEPVTSDSNNRPPLSSPRRPSNEPAPGLPLGDSNLDLAPKEQGKSTDEVEDFLARYAKKYGSGAQNAADSSPIITRSLASAESTTYPRKSASPTRSRVGPGLSALENEHPLAKVTRTITSPDQKSKNQFKNPVPNERSEPANKIKVPRSRANAAKFNFSDATEKTARRINIVSKKGKQVTQLSEATVAADGVSVVPQVLQGMQVIPIMDPSTINIVGKQTHEAMAHLAGSIDVPAAGSTISASSVVPEKRAEPSEFDSTPAFDGQDKKVAQAQPDCSKRQGDCRKEPSISSVLSAPKRKASCEPRTDDMFARRQRDNYLQKGIDLSAHSSRRHAEKATRPIIERRTHSRVPREDSKRLNPSLTTTKPILHHKSATVAGPSRSAASVSDLSAIKKDQDPKQRGHLDLESIDPSETNGRRVSRKDVPSKERSNRTSKPDFEKQADGGRKAKSTLSESNRGRNLISGADSAADRMSLGGAVTERLVSFSQKIMDSFGLLGSYTQADVAELSLKASEKSHLPDSHPEPELAGEDRGGELQPQPSVPQQEPRMIGKNIVHHEHREILIGNDTACSHASHRKVDSPEDHNRAGIPGSRVAENVYEILGIPNDTSRKQSSADEFRGSTEESTEIDNGFDLSTGERSRKRTKLERDGIMTASSAVSSSSLLSDKPQPKVPSSRKRMAGMRNSPRGLLAKAKSKATTYGTTANALNAETKQSSKSSTVREDTESRHRPKKACSLTVPAAPVFTSDVLNQRRKMARAERNRLHEKADGGKSSKSDDPLVGDSVNIRSNKQAYELLEPTVPLPFRFETDARLGSRSQQEFQAKLNVWEQRASTASGSGGPMTSHRTVPDFKSIHAAQGKGLSNMAARRREFIKPTIPVSPQFVVDSRLAERRRFEEVRRNREMEAERVMEEKRRAREEEEGREWREARKRTVPRANPVPDWYATAEVPKRDVRSR